MTPKSTRPPVSLWLAAATIAVLAAFLVYRHEAKGTGESIPISSEVRSRHAPGKPVGSRTQEEKAPAQAPARERHAGPRHLSAKGTLRVPSPGAPRPEERMESAYGSRERRASESSARYSLPETRKEEKAAAPTVAAPGAASRRGVPPAVRPAPEPAEKGRKDEELAAAGIAETAGVKKGKGIMAAVRKLDVTELPGAGSAETADPVLQGVLDQFQHEAKVMDRLQEDVRQGELSGSPVSGEELGRSAREYAKGEGLDEDSADADALAQLARQPSRRIDPAALGRHTREVFGGYKPPTPEEKVRILQRQQNPPPKYGPPPKDALQTYERYREAFDWAEKNLGVRPHHILGILGVETNFGNYTGKHGVMDTLYTLAEKGGRRGKQARRDLAALMRLDQRGELGVQDADSVKGSYAGAMGIPQFLPTSWEAFALDHDGGGRDPFGYPDAIVSVANYLSKHGYSGDVSKAVYGYNHSQEYVNKVLNLSERVKAGLPKRVAK